MRYLTSAWSKIVKAGDSTANWFVQQISYRGKTSSATIYFPYGFHANPKAEESVCFWSAVGDDPANKIGFAWNPSVRPDMAEGEVSVYHPETGSVIKFLASGNIELTTETDVTLTAANINATATGSAIVTAPTITLDGSVTTVAFGTNGTSAQSSATLGAVATDLGSCITLANSIRTALIANGIGE